MRKLALLVLPLWVLAGCAVADAAPVPQPRDARPAVRSTAQYLEVRIWAEADRDEFRGGDRVPLLFTTSEDAHVAVVHLDTDGNLDFVFPYDPRDSDFVQGGRVHALSRGGWNAPVSLRGSPGIGYFYIVASPDPLDYRAFEYGSRIGFSQLGGAVRGDPFLALERVAELLVPDRGYTPFADDVYSYYIGGRHAYPSYSCYDGYTLRDLGRRSLFYDSYYDDCGRVSGLLRSYPNYYDTHRYRGQRRGYVRELERRNPVLRYKEPPNAPVARDRLAPSPRDDRAPAPAARRRPVLERRVPQERPARRSAEPKREQPATRAPAEPRARPVTRPSEPARERKPEEAAPPAETERRPATPADSRTPRARAPNE